MTIADKLRATVTRMTGGTTLRGRVSRVALVKGGELSVTLRFGLEEIEAARKLSPGNLLELIQVTEPPPPEPKKRKEKP